MATDEQDVISDNQGEDAKKLLTQMRKHFKAALEADEEQRRDAMEDMKFTNVPGSQWDENQKKERGLRPCYEYNKLRISAKRIINLQRDNRPAGKVRGVEDSDKDTAEVFEGLIRNIWNHSSADTVLDYAAEYQVVGGYGAWRITKEFTSDDAFEQDLMVDTIYNPFCLFGDPASQDPLKRDGRFWILTDKMKLDEYEEKYPQADVVNFESHEFDDEEDWEDDEEVRVAEYWYKEPYDRELWQLMDGKVIASDAEGADQVPEEMIKNRRMVKANKIKMVIASGNAILEGPVEWEGSMFPFVPVYGEYYVIDGKVHWHGITRFAKDSQRSYNVSRTSLTEKIAMTPNSMFWATAGQAEGNIENWKVAHQKNMPFLLYTPDPKSPGPPLKMPSADVPVALIQETQMAAEEINMVTGIYQQDIGAPNQATSGRQEIARQNAGAMATFNYMDNMAKSVERTHELLIDLIPKVYSTERSIRVLGTDGAEDYVKVNTIVPDPQTGQPVTLHDLSVGRYDVTVTTGPNFTTRRQEAAETYQGLLQGNPEMFQIIGDLVFKSMDLPYAEEISDRMKAMLPPQIQQMLNEEQEVPPEVQAMMAQAKQAMQVVEQQMQEVQQAAQTVQKEATDNDIAKSQIDKAVSDLEAKQSKFEAEIAKEMAKLAKIEADLQMDALEVNKDSYVEGERANLNEARAAMLDSVAAQMAQFNEFAVETMETIRQKAGAKEKIVRIDLVKEGGNTAAVPVYQDD